MKEKIKTNTTLKRKILREYFYTALLPIYLKLSNDYMKSVTGWGGVGVGLYVGIIFFAIILLFFIINPIRILIVCKSELKAILPKIKRVLYYTVVVFPILFVLVTTLLLLINSYLYNQVYYASKSSYSVAPKDYKSAKVFEKQLYVRGLLYNEEYRELLLKLNEKYDIQPQLNEYYYEEASLMTLFSNTFYDSKEEQKIIEFDSSEKAPAYIYNCILTLPDKDEELQYAPISRYARQSSLAGKNYPFFEDFYIECKILFVDGDIYAIIGMSESYNVARYFSNHNEKYNIKNSCHYPYYMILSEKDTITTFVDDKYHSDGAIEEHGSRFDMRLNTAQTEIWHNYPVRKVEKLDVDTINSIAQELQQGILKESIDNHFKEKLK